MTNRTFQPDHPRDWRGAPQPGLRTTIWYPAGPEAKPVRVDFGPPGNEFFLGSPVAVDAKVQPVKGGLPLLVMSHGTGGAAASLSWIGEALAAQGYVVAAVDHPGNNAIEPLTSEGFLLWWERAADLHDVIDGVLADPSVGSLIDRNRIGAVGFSLGGYSVIELAGGRTDRKAFLDYCRRPDADATCTPPEMNGRSTTAEMAQKMTPETEASLARSGDSFRDPRIKAVLAMAPALGRAFADDGLREVTVPVAIVAGDADRIVPVDNNAKRFAALLPHASLTLLPGGSHSSFMDLCLPAGEPMGFCTEAPGVDRAALHEKTLKLAVAFFARTLPPK